MRLHSDLNCACPLHISISHAAGYLFVKQQEQRRIQLIDIKKVAVVCVKQTMEAAFPDEPLKPSTFPDSDGVGQYLIYQNGDVKDVVLDTHQSQANRIEPEFNHKGLVPDSTVKVGEDQLFLTEAGHRLADAVVRFSNKASVVEEALQAFAKGNALKVAKLAPTSLLFGLWDSRKTGTKIVRLFNAEIRAHNVIEVPAAGQFVSSVPRLEDQATKDLSAEGLLDCPYNGLGGVLVKGEIVRNARLNVRGIRTLRGANAEETQKLQQYLLALGLFALSAPASADLREGCNLVATQTHFSVFNEDGTRSDIALKHEDVLAFAKQAAQDFGVGPALEFVYDAKAANVSASGKADAKDEKAKVKKSGKAKADTSAELVQV
jgi:CRISPR-associated protein Csb1